MATTPPPITPFTGAVPQRGDRSTFSPRVDIFVTWLVSVIAQMAALAANIYANAQEAFVSAGTATSAAATAAATANATPWVSGSTIQQYAVVISLLDGATYRRIGATGTSSTDPKLDTANYVALSSRPVFYMKVSDKKSAGTRGGDAASGLNIRTLNTIDWNDIAGASLANNQITLPIGTYEIFARAPMYALNAAHQLIFQNVTDGTPAVIGSAAHTPSSAQTDSITFGQITITSTKVFQLNHYNGSIVTTAGLGNGSGISTSGEFAAVSIKKVA